jgi:hypothetical protein
MLRKRDLILHNHNNDGVDPRLKCMAGRHGALFVMKGGILRSHSLSDPPL